MELSAEDLEDIPVVIQNDQVLECTIRFECKKSNTSEKLFHYFYLNDQQFNRKIVHPNGCAYFRLLEDVIHQPSWLLTIQLSYHLASQK